MISQYNSDEKVGGLEITKMDVVTLMENKTLPDALFIGFGKYEESEKVSKNSLLALKVVIAIEKDSKSTPFNLESFWYKGLKIKALDSLCYYCSNEIEEPSPCRLDMTLKSSGNRYEINSRTRVHSKKIMSELRETFKANLKGGSAYETNYFAHLLLIILSLIPAAGSLGHYTFEDDEELKFYKGTPAQRGLFLITRIILYYYSLFTVNIMWLNTPEKKMLDGLLLAAILLICIAAYLICSFVVMTHIILDFNSFEKGCCDMDTEKMAFGPIAVICLQIVLYILLTISGYYKCFMLDKENLILLFKIMMLLLPINFISNCVSKAKLHDKFLHLAVVFYITVFQFTPYGTLDSFGDDFWFIMLFFVSQVVFLCLIQLQKKFDWTFTFPDKLKCRNYNQFKRKVQVTMSEEDIAETCSLCMNKLTEPEVEYQDGKKAFSFGRINDQNTFYQLDCNHKFHPNCVLKPLKELQRCPHCKKVSK
ncbi:unnamed protein product [Moneuplotes crassus]|uniref:RING-type domain-containing protein n=1 Tax=Euplotes crassus TaxID=5936 RepID=A0AAD1U0U1_EUPCR|nr:unnamed protein product [Moneuplotes crassus]